MQDGSATVMLTIKNRNKSMITRKEVALGYSVKESNIEARTMKGLNPRHSDAQVT